LSSPDERHDQVFLKFDPSDVERMRGFGDVRPFATGERLATAAIERSGMLLAKLDSFHISPIKSVKAATV